MTPPNVSIAKRRTRAQARKEAAIDESPLSSVEGGIRSPVQKKKARRNTLEKGVKSKRARKTGGLARFAQMPIDIFLEMAKFCAPIDLLRLSRTNKLLRSIILRKGAKAMWANALSCVEGLPECPDDLCEPEYTAFVFEHGCQGCGSTRPIKPVFRMRIRVCAACLEEFAIHAYILPQQEREFLRQSLNSGYSSDGIYYNRTRALEALNAFKVTQYDADARKEAAATLLERSHAIGKHAIDLSMWQADRDRDKYRHNRDIGARRRATLFTRLGELGWDRLDITGICKRTEIKKLFNQAQELTPRIWDHLQPKLIPAVEEYRARRLVQEKEMRVIERRHEVSVLMKKLAVESRQRGDHGPIGAQRWVSIFPVGADLFALPSISPLLQDDEVPVTEEMFRLQEPGIVADVKTYQMRVRRLLAAVLDEATNKEKIASPVRWSVDYARSRWEAILGVDTNILQGTDEHNISKLSDPAIFFYWGEPPYRHVSNYPDILRFNMLVSWMYRADYLSMTAGIDATNIATAIIQSSPPISALERTAHAFYPEDQSVCFKCLCCPEGMRAGYSWHQLILHFLEEKTWYETELARQVGQNSDESDNPSDGAPVMLIDDHACPMATLFDPDELHELRDGTMGIKTKPVWACKHCPLKYATKGEAALHLKAK